MPVWSITEREIESSPRERINSTIFSLAKAEASSVGIHPSKVIFIEEEEKDGGVDLEIFKTKVTAVSGWGINPQTIIQVKTNNKNVDVMIKTL